MKNQTQGSLMSSKQWQRKLESEELDELKEKLLIKSICIKNNLFRSCYCLSWFSNNFGKKFGTNEWPSFESHFDGFVKFY